MLILPWTRVPIQIYRAELEQLERFERQRMADWAFSEIKEKLYNHEIPWRALPIRSKEKTVPLNGELSEQEVRIGGSVKKFKRSYKIVCSGEKTTPQSVVYRIFLVTVEISPKLPKEQKYLYRVIVRKLPTSVQ